MSRRRTLLFPLALLAGFGFGRAACADALTDALATMPPNSWKKLNLNRFQDVWTPELQRPTWGAPNTNISDWSGAAWDSKRNNLLIWGGGQSGMVINSDEGNEFYIFETATGLWKRGSLPSQITPNDDTVPAAAVVTAIDGVFNAPVSGESWDNLVYLENVDRVAVIAVSRDAKTFRKLDGSATGPYFWDPAKADSGKVGGTTGSHVNPSLFPDVLGGQMWQNRDNVPNASQYEGIYRGITGVTAYVNRDGKDVVYFSGDQDRLWRYTVQDLNPANDRWELIGIRNINGWDGWGAGAFDATREVFLQPLPGQAFSFWDVNARPGNPESNRAVRVVPTVLSGTPPSQFGDFGVQYDPALDGYLLWSGDDEVWLLDPPDNLDPDGDGIQSESNGWTLQVLNPQGPGPTIPSVFTGVYGKWAYLPQQHAYLGVIDPISGDVFVYKPPYAVVSPDSTPPAIVPSLSGIEGNSGWFTSDVGVSWSVTDPESSITQSTGCEPSLVTSDTANRQLTCLASSSGGQSSRTVIVKRDATAPEASAAPTSLPNSYGWYKADVTIRVTGLDATSGVASCTSDTVLSQEGTNLTSAAGHCIDVAGNASAPVSASGIRVDKTGPVVTGTTSSQPNATGWYQTAVTVSFAAADTLSGVEPGDCDPSVTLTADGTGQSVTGGCRDRAGNHATTTVANVNIDRTPPFAIVGQDPPPNAAGWNNTDVTVSFSATDSMSGSGVARCPAPELIANEVTGLVTSGTCDDIAGNISNTASVTTNIDRTPPTVAITAPASGASYFVGTTVTADFGCSDTRSGVASCAGSVPEGGTLDTSTIGQKTFSVQAYDAAGNSSATAHTYSVVAPPPPPTVEPVLSGTLGSNGWYTSNVTLTWSISGAVTTTSGCNKATVRTDTSGTAYTCNATNNAGTTSRTVTIKRDASAPSINVTVPGKNARFAVNQVVYASYSCADNVSGLDETQGCVGSVSNGARLDTSVLGTRSLKVSAKNGAGGVSTATATYTVR